MWTKISINFIIVLILLLHTPVVVLQLYSQCKKLRIDDSQPEEDDATTEVSLDHEETATQRRKRSGCICWKNFTALWSYEPQ